jgi:hypothetical protein
MSIQELFTPNYWNIFSNTLTTNTLVATTLEIQVLDIDDMQIIATIDSTSPTTGALTVAGGTGIIKNLNVGGLVNFSNTTNTSSISTGSLLVSGGVGITKNFNVGGLVNFLNTTDTSGTSTGSLVVSGGVGISKSLTVGGLLSLPSNPIVTLTSVAFGGAITANSTIYIYQFANMISLRFDYLSATNSSVAQAIYTASGTIPSKYCPATHDINIPCTVINGSAPAAGTMNLQASGLLQFYVGANSNFGTSGNNGWYQNTFTYILP